MKKEILGLALIAGLTFGGFTVKSNARELDPSAMGGAGIGDVTGNGRPDIVCVADACYGDKDDNTRSYLMVKENLGNGEYKNHRLDIGVYGYYNSVMGKQEHPRPLYIQVYDMNGDGLGEIIIKDGWTVTVFENKGNLKFEEKRLK